MLPKQVCPPKLYHGFAVDNLMATESGDASSINDKERPTTRYDAFDVN